MLTVRRGFTLVEVLLVALIVMIVATIAVPSLGSYLDFVKAQQTATLFQTLASKDTAFFNIIGKYPGRVSQLSNVIVASTNASLNSCGAQYVAKNVTSWTGSGPFYPYYGQYANVGMYTPLGAMQDSMSRNPCVGVPCTAQAGFIEIRMLDMPLSDAQNLDYILDASDGGGAGRLRYTTPSAVMGAGYADVKYEIGVTASC